MFQAIGRMSAILVFLAAFFYFGQDCSVRAQIAPTNTATIGGSVSDNSGKPLPGADVTLSGPRSTSAKTDGQGLFVFVGMPSGAYKLSVSTSSLGTVTRTIDVQGDITVAIQYEPAGASGLKTIASVAASARFNVTPASVTQVNPIANAFDGKTSWRTILEQIPGVAQAGLQNGANAFATIPDSPLSPMQISINGALPYETATLLDNMPLVGIGAGINAGAGTDLSFYPLNGFGSADVIRGPGANAPSIVDSIGGSFVLHAPGTVTKNRMELSTSTDPYGGIVTNALLAERWNKLSFTATYGVNDSPGPFNRSAIPASIVSFERPLTVDGRTFSCSAPCFSTLFDFDFTLASNPRYGFNTALLTCCFQETTAWSEHTGSAAFTYALSPTSNLEIFFAGESTSMAAPFPYYSVNFVPPAGYTGPIAAGQHFFTLQDQFLAPQTEHNSSSLIEEKFSTKLGNGSLRLAALQNSTWETGAQSNAGSATVQLFGTANLNGTPTIFNGETHSITFTKFDFFLKNGARNRDLSFVYDTPLGENMHAGASFVKSYYNNIFEDVTAFGPPLAAFGSSSAEPSANSETTSEGRIFIGATLSQKTSLDLSMYFARAAYHIQDPNDPTGATYVDQRYTYTAPRLGFVWRPSASIAVRAAAGGGFAEAPLSFMVGTNVTTLCGPFFLESATNLNLQPEKSFAFDVGTDIRLRGNTIVSFDVYRATLHGQFYNSTSAAGTFGGLPLFVSQFENLGVSRYEGLLVDIRHDVQRGVYWSASGGLTRGYVVSVPPGFYDDATGPCDFSTGTTPGGNFCPNLNVVPGVNFNGTFSVSIPYAQGLETIGYRWNREKYIDLVGTYFGNNNTYFRPAFAEFDAHLSYPLTPYSSILLTFNNVTGIYNNSVQSFTPASLRGAPAVAGLPYVLYGEPYGPRTLQLTFKLHR